MAQLLVMGGGKMGEALVAGLLGVGWSSPAQVVIVEKSAERRAQLLAADGLAGRFPGLSVTEDVVPADGAIVAVKPADVEGACVALRAGSVHRILSIAAGVGLADLERWLGPQSEVVRAMPNTAALVGEAASAIAPGTHAGDEVLAWAGRILGSVGVVVTVPESLLDAVTGLSGSGPAYIFLVAEALIEAGVLAGLPRSTSETLAVQTVLGAARMLAESGHPPEVLRAQVTSPGGTTAAGLRTLEGRAVRSAFLEAVASAAERSRELGR